MEKKTTDQEIQKELQLLKTQQKKSTNEIKNSKQSLINQIKGIDKNLIINSPVIEKEYTIWERVRKVLGMS